MPKLVSYTKAAAGSLLLISASSFSVELSYGVYAETIASDNSTRVAQDEESEVQAIVGGDLRLYSTEGGQFRYDINYDARYVNYTDDTYDDQSELTGRSLLELYFIPELLSWDVIHRQTRTKTSGRDEANPDNIERRSTWQTGPSVYWNASPVDLIELRAFISQTRFEDTESADSERRIADMAWNRRLDQISTLRVFAQAGEVEFENRTDSDYELMRYGAGFVRNLNNWSWGVDLGGNTVDREVGDSVDGFFVRGSVNYNVGRNFLSFRLSREVTDSSIGLGLEGDLTSENDPDQPDVNNSTLDIEDADTNFDIQDIVERTRLDFTFQHAFARSTLGLNAFWDEEDFDVVDDDQTTYGAGINWLLNLNYRSSFYADARWTEREFDAPVLFSSTRTFDAGLTYNYRLSEFITLSGRVSHNRLTREDAPSTITPVDETRFAFRFSYILE